LTYTASLYMQRPILLAELAKNLVVPEVTRVAGRFEGIGGEVSAAIEHDDESHWFGKEYRLRAEQKIAERRLE